MNKRPEHNRQWFHYLETPRQTTEPVKIDAILEKRMKAFLKARQLKSRQTAE